MQPLHALNRLRSHHDLRIATIAVAMFAAITLLRFVFGDPAVPITLLYTIPISLLALEFGFLGGGVGLATSLLLVGAWALVDRPDLEFADYTGRIGVFCATCIAIGLIGRRLAREAHGRRRWFEMSNDMLCEVSCDGFFLELNDQWQRTLGWTREELRARPFIDFVHPRDVEKTVEVAAGLTVDRSEAVDFENRYRAKDGSWHWLLWSSRSDGKRIYAVAKDITDRQGRAAKREELLDRERAMARTDQLTGLPNRRAWDEELRRELARSRRHGNSLTVAIVDLDHFKEYNDARGHLAGDELLRQASANWRLAIRLTDFVARIGGEEFGVLFPECPPGNASEVLERLRAATPAGQSCSAGIAVWNSVETAEELMGRIDTALYEAKRQGRDRAVLAYP
jgi:diguanylate cyclase (GGDEF)-like protein/PAS domain S-box-containing protein